VDDNSTMVKTILEWSGPIVLAIAALVKAIQNHKLLIELKIQMNGRDTDKKDVATAQRASGIDRGGDSTAAADCDPPV